MKKLSNKGILIFLVVLCIAVYLRLGFSFFSHGTLAEIDTCSNKYSGEVPDIFVEKNTGLNFVEMGSGCFYMGSSQEDPHVKNDELPLTLIHLKDFYICSTEVSKEAFAVFVAETGYRTTAEKQGFSWVFSDLTGKWEKKKNISWKNPGFDQDMDHPVVHVSFYDATEFTNWLSSKNKDFSFRLPTEQEWEFAARGGLSESRFVPKEDETLCTYINGADLSARHYFKGWKVLNCFDGFPFTAPVESLKPSSHGLYHMLGNVWEWCDSRYYPEIRKKNKKIYGNKAKVVIRGGSFYSKPEYLRFAERDFLASPEKRGYDIGFRPVMTKE